MDPRRRTITELGQEDAEELRGVNVQLSAIREEQREQTRLLEIIANAVTGGSPPPSTNGHVPQPD